MAPILVKAQLGDDLRRFNLCEPSYARLSGEIARVFALGAGGMTIRYRDDEGDLVTLASDLELTEALRICGDRLRIAVDPSAPAPAPATPPAAAVPPPATATATSTPTAPPPSPPAPRPAPVPEPRHTSVGAFLASVLQRYFPARTVRSMRDANDVLVDLDLTQHLDTLERLLNNSATRARLHTVVETFAAEMHALIAELHGTPVAAAAAAATAAAPPSAPAPAPEPVPTTAPARAAPACSGSGPTLSELTHPFAQWFRPRGPARSGPFARGARGLGARFLSDVSIPDGTQIQGSVEFTKTWRLKNTGTHAWPNGCQLVFVGGDDLRAGVVPAIPAVAPGVEALISIKLKAPPAGGRYVTYFRLATESGERFGQRVWSDIVVPACAPPAAEPAAEEQRVEEPVEEPAQEPSAPAVTEPIPEPAQEEPSAPSTEESVSGSVSFEKVEVQDAIAEDAAAAPEPAQAQEQAAEEPEPVAEEPDNEFVDAPNMSDSVLSHMSSAAEKIQGELVQLKNMGFDDDDLNTHLLRKYNHDIPRVIDALLAGDAGDWTMVNEA